MDESATTIVSNANDKRGCSGWLKAGAVVCFLLLLAALLLPAKRSAREAARRNQCMSQMKQMALALNTYAEAHGSFPPAYTTDENGKPLHSWRTLILPYMEEAELFKSIDLKKPWDDPANAEAFKKVIEVYRCPSSIIEDNRTTYLAVVTPNSLLQATTGRTLEEVKATANKTVMLVEVGTENAVPWMQPVDADEQMVLGIGGDESKLSHPGVTNVAWGDGRCSAINFDMPEDIRRQLIDFVGNTTAAAKRE
jgi:hypothetical protein